jgi:CubicO group peptidase (beta-lactamase class C family)
VVRGSDGAAVVAAVQRGARAAGLTSVLYRVTRANRVIASGAVGESFAGRPADTSMHFRVGNVGFAYLGTLLLLMAEAGDVGLDDTVASRLPDLDVPNADRVTLEMLANNTSGYPDYVRTDAFVDEFLRNPFADFAPSDLIRIGMSLPPWYEPGTGWSYAHTNYLILGEALSAAAGEPLADLLRKRVIEPMGLEATAPALSPALPTPTLHTYSGERDVWEDTTNWNPSWQTAPGSVITSNICDLATSAVAIGAGGLLSKQSYRRFVSDATSSLTPPPGCPPDACRALSDDRYYGLGTIVWADWVAQAPLFGGFSGVHAYLPDEELAVAIVAVAGPTSTVGRNEAVPLWAAIAQDLTPDHVPAE